MTGTRKPRFKPIAKTIPVNVRLRRSVIVADPMDKNTGHEIIVRLNKIIILLEKQNELLVDDLEEGVPEDFMYKYPMNCTCHEKGNTSTVGCCPLHD
jgi:hypothetical protein